MTSTVTSYSETTNIWQKFCPKCGSFWKIDYRKKTYICSNCGNKEPLVQPQRVYQNKSKEEKVIIVGIEDKNTGLLPKIKKKCPKCNNDEAFLRLLGSKNIDDSFTECYKCTNCSFTWREYG